MKSENQYTFDHNNMSDRSTWKLLNTGYAALHKAACESHTLDPKFNAIHWAHDVALICEEIEYSISRMRVYASNYMNENPGGSSPVSVSPLVTYYADNAITRIHSCRDKLALMIWAHFCPFNPLKRDEVLDFHKVKSRLMDPIKYGIKLNNHEVFLEFLDGLDNEDFQRITTYRHQQIHRREPRIEIHGVKSFHDWPYNLPITDDIEIQKWEHSIKDDPFEVHMPGELRKQCTFDGVLYESKKQPNRLWDYEDVNIRIESTSSNLVSAAVGCFQIIRRRSPFRKQK